MRTNNKQAMKAKNSNLSQKLRNATIGIIGVCAFPLMINDSDYFLVNFAGIGLLALAGYLHHKWNIIQNDDVR